MPMPPAIHRALVALATGLLLSVAACSDRAPVATLPAPTLSLPETHELVETIAQVTSVDIAAVLRAGTAQPPVSIAADFFTDTLACPSGGISVVHGLTDFDLPGDETLLQWIDEFRGCAAESPQGRRWEFDAQLPLITHFTIASESDTVGALFTGRIVGRIRFATDGATGSCDVDIRIAGLHEEIAVTGSVCGHATDALRPTAVAAAQRETGTR
jgi:hypothetical protein